MNYFIQTFIKTIIPTIINNTIYKKNKNKTDIDSAIEKLNQLFSEIKRKPYVTIKLLEKDYKIRYIKFGVSISNEGIADILLEGSPFDEMHRLLNIYHNNIMKNI